MRDFPSLTFQLTLRPVPAALPDHLLVLLGNVRRASIPGYELEMGSNADGSNCLEPITAPRRFANGLGQSWSTRRSGRAPNSGSRPRKV